MKKIRSIHHYKRIKGVWLMLTLVFLIGQLSEVAGATGNNDIQASVESEDILAGSDEGETKVTDTEAAESETNEISAESMESMPGEVRAGSEDEEVESTYAPPPEPAEDDYGVIDPTSAADATAWTEATLVNAIAGAPLDGTLYEIEIDLGFPLTSTIVIPEGANISIYTTSGFPRRTITQPNADIRHFSVEGSLTLANIILEGNGIGGGVELPGKEDAVLTMNSGAVIQKCHAEEGGGVYVKNGKLYMYDAVIQSCTANDQGGGVFAVGSKFHMDGGKLSRNIAYGDGGGAQIKELKDEGPSTCELTGDAVIEYNKAMGTWENAARNEYSTGSGGGILFASTGNITINGNVKICYNEAIAGNPTRNPGNYGGGVYLSGIIAKPDELGTGVIGGNVEIFGNTARNGGGVIVESSFILTLNNGKIYENTAVTSGGGIWVMGGGMTNVANAFLKMTGGEIYGNTASNGGGIYIHRFAEVDMSGGKIGGLNEADQGGGVYLAGKYTMTAGTVSYNKASQYGGGIFVQSVGSLELKGGSITNNESDYGGGVYLRNSVSSVIMSGGEIGSSDHPNKALSDGGGVYVQNGSFTMEGGTISGNMSAVNGGGVYMMGGTFTQDGSPISANTAAGNGGGVYVDNAVSTYEMKNGAVIGGDALAYGNKATNGGGMYINSGSLTIEDGTVGYNEAVADGGGAFVSSNGELTATGGTITHNKAGSDGGGIYTAAAGANPEDYNNLVIGSSVIFSDNSAVRYYDPLDGDTTYVDYWTGINNTTYTSAVDPTVVSRLVSVNNFDINTELVKVTFNLNGGDYSINGVSQSIPPQAHLPGAKVTDPEDNGTLFFDEYVFDGWYTDDGTFADQWDFENDTLSEDITLHAKWSPWAAIDFEFTKANETETAGLPGAEFTLYKWIGAGSPGAEALVVSGSTDWEEAGSQSSGANGLTKFQGLTAGIYQLVENEASSGYETPEGQWRFEVTKNITANKYEIGTITAIVGADGKMPPAFTGRMAIPGSAERTLPNKRLKTFTFTKVKAENTDEVLPDAKFQLYVWTGTGTAPDLVENSTVNNGTTVTDQWELVDTQLSAADGKVVFEDLADAVYQLVETAAPAGYLRPVGQWQLTLNTLGEWQITGKGSMLPPAFMKENGKLSLPNIKNKLLPMTGFYGITGYLMAGAAMMILTAVSVFILFLKRKFDIKDIILTKGGGRKKIG